MPSLQDCPLEIRQKIHGLLLNVEDEITIDVTSRETSSSTPNIEVALVTKCSDPNPSLAVLTALTQVSKEVRSDVLPVFFGAHKFIFESSKALQLFLNQIGFARKYLRHIRIHAGGYQHDSGEYYRATRLAFGLLACAGGLQSLTVSHIDFCAKKYSKFPKADLRHFANACLPLLKCLKFARSKNGLKGSLLDIVNIQLPDCEGCSGCRRTGRQCRSRRTWHEPGVHDRLRCRCYCLEADKNNEALNEQFRSRLTEMHLLED